MKDLSSLEGKMLLKIMQIDYFGKSLLRLYHIINITHQVPKHNYQYRILPIQFYKLRILGGSPELTHTVL